MFGCFLTYVFTYVNKSIININMPVTVVITLMRVLYCTCTIFCLVWLVLGYFEDHIRQLLTSCLAILKLL